MPALLVSVRDSAEVGPALEGGAALIDVKEPAAGSLGRAADEVRETILDTVAGRVPVSAALGELVDEDGSEINLLRIAYVKYGVARCAERDWRTLLRARRARVEVGGCRLVVSAYADWRRAEAPAPAEVFRFAGLERAAVVLLDTWGKDGSTLLDWLSVDDILRLCESARAGGSRVALAGSLGRRQMTALSPARPDWFAVRGAVCVRGARTSSIDPERVRELAELLRSQGFAQAEDRR